LFFTLIPVLALLSNYDRENCLINVGTEGGACRFQAAQGGYRTNPTEDVSAVRIEATSGHSGELRVSVRGNANLAGQTPF